jgi:hypothetical protein
VKSAHVVFAAVSVVTGSLAGAGVNLATGRPTPAIVLGTAILVVAWAGLEAWRAARSSDDATGSGGVAVRQNMRRVDGRMIGYRGRPVGGPVEIDQRVQRAGSGSEIIGYDGDAAP